MGNQASSPGQSERNDEVVSGPPTAYRVGGGTEGRVGLRGKSFMDSALAKG